MLQLPQDNRRRDAWNSGTKNGSRTRKKEDSKALVTIDGEGVDWTNHSEEDEDYALMACNSSDSDTEVISYSNKCKESYANLKKLYDAQREQLIDESIENKRHILRYDGILSYENEVLQSVFMNKKSELEKQPLYDRFVTAEGMHAVPLPMIGNYMPSGPDIEVDYSQFTYGPKQTQPSDSESQTSEFDTCESNISIEPLKLVNENYCSMNLMETVKNQYTHSQKPKVDKKELRYGFTVRACFVCGSLNHLIRDCDFHEKRMARKAELNNGWNKKFSQKELRETWNNVQRVNKQNQFVPSAVLTSGTKNVSTARQSFNRQTVLTSTAMKVNTVKPMVNRVRPANVFHNTHSPSSRPFKRTTVLSKKISNQKINTAKVNAVSTVGGKRETAVKPSAGCNWRPQRHNWHNDYPHRSLKNKGIVDSGCSRHMTGNKAYLAEFQDFNGGPVAFGGSKGYITGKGKIKTGKLDFEDVCFVKELQHFNLFSVSQMCDKKNKVLFTDSECLVLSPEFKLPDENQVLLKIPRQKIQFKNRDVIEFCGSKGIKREYSNARDPTNNMELLKRKNMGGGMKGGGGPLFRLLGPCLQIPFFLPILLWLEAVSTACYVLNRVLVTKPHNKTPYELLTGKIPIISYIRPFGCHVTILNTINHLGKFAGKFDEGFLVGYSLQSKAFRVYNLETKRVEENLHITFLENKPNVAGKGPTWLFDLDYLTDSMNYHPVRSENQANLHAGQQEANQNAGTEDIIDAGDSEKEDESAQDCFILPIWPSYSSTITPDLKTDEKREGPREEEQVFLDELERLKRQEKEANEEAEALRKEFAQETENLVIQEGAAKTSSTNIFSTVSTPAKASSTNLVNTVSIPVSTASPHEGLYLSDPTNPKQDDSKIPPLEDIYQNSSDGIFTTSSYDDEGAVADFTNLETVVNVSHIPTSRIIFSHPLALILGDPTSAVQTRSKVNKSFGAHAFVSYVQKQRNNHKDFQHCLFACFLSQNEPKKISEALEDENLPFGKKAIGTKWVYRNKKDERGVIVRNKARLVAQGHRQEEGIDYDEVFAPVARIEAIRIFLAFASYMGFIVYQMDVKSAFLYGKINEEVYVSQPPSFLDPKYPQKNGYRRGTIDKTLFIKKDKHDIILVQVYVDDIIFGSTKKSWCDEFEALMKSRFQMSSMEELTFFLGLQVKQKADGIFISQDKYVADILKKFDFVDVKSASTPIETQKPLVKDEEASDVDVHLYRPMIGSLMYLTASRPDIMFAVCACSRFQVTPKSSHLSAVKRIFRYLKGKPKLGLWYPRVSSFDLEAYLDSDYAGANLDRKSTTGGCQFLGRKLISWQCKKQTIVATSTTEAEYVAAARCCGQNPVYHSKTKHIAIKHHFIRDAYEKKLIQVLKIHTDDNVVDLLTKAFDVSSTDNAKLVPLGKVSTTIETLKKDTAKEKTDGNAEFYEIIDFLTRISIYHALAAQSAKVAGKSVSISEASIRSDLLFDDADGIDTLPNQAIFDAIQQMGSKSTSWDQIPTNIATAVICLTSNQKYNFSKLIFDGKQLANVSVPLDHFPVNTLTSKVFSFMVKKGKHFSGKVTPLFATMLVQPTQDEGASSERPSEALPTPSPAPTSEIPLEPQPDSSPAQTSEVPIEHQSILSPRPSPTTTIPDSNPEASGENLGGHSSSDRSLSGNEGDMTLQSVYDLCLSLCAQVSDQAKEIQDLKAQITKLKKQAKPVIKHHKAYLKSVSLKQRFPRKSFSKKHRVHKESVSKQGRKYAKGESSVQRDPLFDEVPEDTVDHMDTENAQDEGRTMDIVDEDKEFEENVLSTEEVLSTDKEGVSTDFEKVSTDFEKVSTDGSKVSTDKQIEGTDEQVEGTEEQNEDTVENFEGTEENIEGTEEKSESTDGHKKGTEEEIAAQATQTSTQTPTSKMFGDDETIAKVLLNMSQA
ncbi:putative ribonuclease H-like domain-containing protein, partial [Tanacetum coccineum]